MTRLESAATIEAKVGAARHPADHLARAVSVMQRVYILHSTECLDSGIDLRTCPYSIALDHGINLGIWNGFEDQVVTLMIDADTGDLLPTIGSRTPSEQEKGTR